MKLNYYRTDKGDLVITDLSSRNDYWRLSRHTLIGSVRYLSRSIKRRYYKSVIIFLSRFDFFTTKSLFFANQLSPGMLFVLEPDFDLSRVKYCYQYCYKTTKHICAKKLDINGLQSVDTVFYETFPVNLRIYPIY